MRREKVTVAYTSPLSRLKRSPGTLDKKERLALARALQGKGYHLTLILDYLGTYEEGTLYDIE